MRLKGIRLKNYRRFRDAALEFPDGLIGVVGRNGAGKSTLVEAVLWCLFGHDAARTSKDLLKRQGAAPGEDVLVRLDFEFDSMGYAVTRRLRGKSLQPEASIESGGHLLVAPGPNSWDQANQALVGILGLDRGAFESTVVAKQGELAALSDLRAGERKRLLLGLLGIDRVEDAVQAVRAAARETEARLAGLRRDLERETALRVELATAEAEATQARAELEHVTTELGGLEGKLANAKEAARRRLQDRLRDQELRGRLQSLQSRLESVWQQRTRLSADAQILRDRASDVARMEKEAAAFDGLDVRVKASEEARVQAERAASLRDRLAAVDASLARWSPLLEAHAANGSSPSSLESELATHAQRTLQTRERLVQSDAESRSLARELGSTQEPDHASHALEGLEPSDPCPACERVLGEAAVVVRRRADAHRRERETFVAGLRGRLVVVEEAMKDARSELADAEAKAKDVQTRLEGVRRRLRDAEVAGAEVERLRGERAEVAAILETLGAVAWDAVEHARLLEARTRRERLNEALGRAREAVARLPRIQDEDRVLAAQDLALVHDKETAARELQQLGYAQGAWESANTEAERLARDAEGLGRARTQWAERLQAHERAAARVREDVERLETRKAEADAVARRLRLLDLLAAQRGDQGLLPEFKTHLIGRLRPALAHAASDLLGRMTGGRYSEIVLDEDYGGRIYDGGVAHPLERFSGGEVDVANLALRLAVSELVTNARGRSRLQFVALDEVFGSQDEERRKTVLESLQALSNVFRQVFVVTHLEDVRERLEHIVRVEDASDGTGHLDASWAKA